ncbi:glycosyltransferase family 92 protein [Pseudorhodobacter sp. W20_MBD10_FR17]|uniref:glycosyltransferase family 92 protein n=1 Tax=Pseudorhodobacter sp. W20_MBD10_FR17 TaxID=3240266 RepID=UPI003F984CD3
MLFWARKTALRASKIDIKPPTAQADRTGLALVTIVRDEAPYIGDWLRFHALAGVTDFFIYDNQSSDQTIEIAKSFASLNITIIPWALDTSSHKPKMVLPRQILAYCHAISNFGGAFRWMGFIDIDEYLVPKNDNTILESLTKLEHFTNISLPWVMFGHGGHDTMPTSPVPFCYTERASHQTGKLLNFKCIVDPCDVTQVSTHKFETKTMGAKTANMNGAVAWNKTRGTAGFTTTDGLQLNHYYLRSRAEMEQKISGPAVSGTEHSKRKAAILEKAAQIEKMATLDTSATSFLQRHAILTGDDLRKAVL